MNLIELFALRKKQKIPFKIPNKIREFRTKVEAESRENYPSIVRYHEIHAEAKSIYAHLNGIIARKEYAKEAMKIKEDIKNEMAQLTGKIRKNMQ